MKTIFNVKDLEDGWEFNDFLEVHDMAEEYCVSVLEIPSEFIKEIRLKGGYLDIELVNTKEYAQEDWYINLCRSSELYARCA